MVQRAKAPSGGPGAIGGRGPAAGGPMRGTLVTVGQAMVQRKALPLTLNAMGTVMPVTTVTLTSQVSGVLSEVLFTEGQLVKKGQKLVQIDPRPFEQALMQARGTLARDSAQLDAARVTLKRYQVLWGQDSVARQDLDTQAALTKQLEGTVLGDQAQVKAAELNLGYTRITAPLDGRIGLRNIDVGNYVSVGGATGIAVITQESPINVSFAVPQDQIPAVLEAQRTSGRDGGLRVQALDRGGLKTLATGVFSTLDNQVDTTTGTVKAKARFANADGVLFPNQFVNVRLMLKDESALVVPVTAIRTGGNGDFVYVINDDHTVTQRTVIRGISTVDWIAITNGLKEGERVVTEGADRLKDGASVQLQGETPSMGGMPGTSSRGSHSGKRRGAQAGDAATAAAGTGSNGGTPAQPAAGAAPAATGAAH